MKSSWLGIAVALAVGLLCACTDGGRGIVFDDQGGGPDSPERATARTERLLDQNLRAAGIRAASIHLATPPVWARRHRRAEEEWLFTSADLELNVAEADRPVVEDIVRTSLRPCLADGVIPHITFLSGVASTPAPAPAPAPAITPAPQPVIPASGISYVIQRGDTLGQLSMVFYGSAQHWRRIYDANPGVFEDGGPKVGATIIIPPAIISPAISPSPVIPPASTPPAP